jgi:hypothetical protein
MTKKDLRTSFTLIPVETAWVVKDLEISKRS